ncbi:Spo0E family sporulation regulatory protein-aspartic acid phosphatase [Pseudoneobacillus sp. C159]
MLKNELIQLIEIKRAELIKIVNQNGFSSSLAIRCSQELDILLNEYNRIYINKASSY